MEPIKKNTISLDHYLLANSIAAALMILFLIVLTVFSYRKTRAIDVENLAGSEHVQRNLELLDDLFFLETVVAVHDAGFLDHHGFVLIDDFRNLVGSAIGHPYPNHTITREIAASFTVRGKMPGFYRKYLLPVRLENNLSKHELLAMYMYQMENMAGTTFREIVRRHEFGRDKRYDWIFINSIFLSELIDKPQPEIAEQLFFRILNRMYHTGHLERSDLDEIRTLYRTRFLDDVCRFFCGTRAFTHPLALTGSGYGQEGLSYAWPAHFGGAMKFADLVAHFADKHQISFPLFLAIVQSESNGDPNAVSHADAYGLAQIILPTGRMVTGNPLLTTADLMDPYLNLDTSARYIRSRKDSVDAHFPHLPYEQRIALVAASYNAGWGRVKRVRGVPNIRETRDYVQRVHRYHDLYRNNLDYILRNATSAPLTAGIQ